MMKIAVRKSKTAKKKKEKGGDNYLEKNTDWSH